MKKSGLGRLALFTLMLAGALSGACSSTNRSGAPAPFSMDMDVDGVLDFADNCPSFPNPAQLDADLDQIGDFCDICPADPYVERELYFEPLTRAATNPGPTDFITLPDPASPTGLRLNMLAEEFPASFGAAIPLLLYTFNQLDGMSATGDIMVYLSAAPDESSINDDTVMVINNDPASPHYLEKAPIDAWYELRTNPDTGGDLHAIVIRPLDPLYSRTQYLVVVTNGLASTCGEKFVGSSDMEALKSYISPGGGLDSPWRNYQGYLSTLRVGKGLLRENISLLFPYTTQSVAEDLIAVREKSLSQPPPSVTITDVFPPLDSAGNVNWADLTPHLPVLPSNVVIHPGYFTNIAMVVYGTFPSPSHLNSEKVFQLDPATFIPLEFGSEDLEFMLVLPLKAEDGPVPVVVFGHALGVCKETLLAIGDTFARYGFATVGIDISGHGSRSASGVECGANGDLLKIFLPIISPDNILSIRDFFKQGVADEIYLARMLEGLTAADLDVMPTSGGAPLGDGVLDLDASRIAFCSQSLGSLLGGALFSVEQDLNAGVLNVGGGYFSYFVKVFIGDLADNLLSPELLVGVQMVMDGADPLNYARAIVREPFEALTNARPRNVLLQEAVDDDTVPNLTTELLAIAMGADQIGPIVKPAAGMAAIDAPVTGNISDSVTAGMFQFHPVEHEFLLKPDNPAATVAAQEQAAIFLSSAFSNPGGASTIINTFYTQGPPVY